MPPNAVSTSTIPGGSVRTSPISAAPLAARDRAQRRERRVGCLGRDEGDHHALVGDVHRVDPEHLGGAGDVGAHRDVGLARPRSRRRRRAIPVLPDVAGACELLGIDPMYVANEGVMVAFVGPSIRRGARGDARAEGCEAASDW